MNYIEALAEEIERRVPADAIPEGETRILFLMYAVLALSRGDETARRDVHNAWSAWMTLTDPDHESIRPYDELSASVRDEDDPYVDAIRAVAASLKEPPS